jgi:hypothetical protein
LGGLLLLKPTDTLSHVPLAISLLPILCEESAKTVLFPIEPLSSVFSPIWPGKGAKTMLSIIEIFSFVFPAIWPVKDPFAFHFIELPLSSILSSVSPSIESVTLYMIVNKLALI